jgi:hypothetical protein
LWGFADREERGTEEHARRRFWQRR